MGGIILIRKNDFINAEAQSSRRTAEKTKKFVSLRERRESPSPRLRHIMMEPDFIKTLGHELHE